MMTPLRQSSGMTSVSQTTEKTVCRRSMAGPAYFSNFELMPHTPEVLLFFSLFTALLISEMLNGSVGRSPISMAGLGD